ncbi:glutamate racemase [Paenibacillus phyllosphaerae]|uniref:Glutamate racemase n=1 Tax=Paenibacillus phyllosphaerae TaxID=274593 RepID=A0A7W5B5E4_9BACL|nr:glutamate racemase [Paenibacillus phyllosphaerae]MBB3114602.1 glutamate racemase [Paenibacillus phyllosphaerae]
MRIAFFDSGLGGLTVLAEALRQLPDEQYLYFADTLHVPYGPKPHDEVKRYIRASMEQVMKEEVKAVVIACNTATSLAIAELRQHYDIPIIGMEPAVKPAVEMNRASGKRVLVLATPITLRQSKYIALISRVDNAHIVDSLPLPELVQFCEELCFDQATIRAYFEEKLSAFDLRAYGTLVLGCTHFPFYRELLREFLPGHIQLVDGSKGTVNRLVEVLAAERLLESGGQGEVRYQCSSGDEAYIARMKRALAIYQNTMKQV